jgi:hypothetical protein
LILIFHNKKNKIKNNIINKIINLLKINS